MEPLTGVGENRVPNRTVMFDKSALVFWIAVTIIYATTAWAFLSLLAGQMSRRVHDDLPIKGVVVVNRAGEVVECDGKAKVKFGQNLLLLLPYAETAEARQKMLSAERMTLKTSIGTVELAATTDDRMIGVIK